MTVIFSVYVFLLFIYWLYKVIEIFVKQIKVYIKLKIINQLNIQLKSL